MNRFFLPASAIKNGAVAFDGPTAHQLRDVLRLGSGDRVIVLDDSGWEYSVLLDQVERGSASGSVESKKLSAGEPKTKIVVFQALLKGSKFEWVLQKGTEIGVVAFVPVITARSIPVNDGENASRTARWQRIIQEAAEQSRRARLPRLHPPTPFGRALGQAQGLTLIPWESESSRSLRSTIRDRVPAGGGVFSVNLFIGPEGGFTDDEVAAATAAKAIPVTLGTRILRAETAGLVAATAVLYQFGDLGD